MPGKPKKEDKKASKDNGGRWSLKGMLSVSSQTRNQKKDNDKVSRSESRQRIRTTPVFQTEDDAPSFPVQLPIAKLYTRDHAGPSDQPTYGTETAHFNSGNDFNTTYPSSNGTNPNFNDSRTHTLQAQIDPVNHHPESVSPPPAAITPPSPDLEYEHLFSDPTKTFKVNEVANTEVLPGSSEQPPSQQRPAFELSGEGAKANVPELSTDSRDTTPAELATSYATQSSTGGGSREIVELPSSPRPRPAALTPHSNHASAQRLGGQEQRQPMTSSGLGASQNTHMALQAATLAIQTMPRKALSSGAPAGPREPPQTSATPHSRLRSESGNSMTTNIPPEIPGQFPPDSSLGDTHLDLGSDPEDNVEEQTEEDEGLLRKEPTVGGRQQTQDQNSLEENEEPSQRLGLRFRYRKRDSDKKGAQLRKAAPQTSTTSEWSIADQKRLGAFLKDHKVPKKPYLDPLSMLLEWVPMKLADADSEIRARDKELNRQATANKQQKDEIIRLKAELASKERSEQKTYNDWIKADKQLKKGSGETSRLRVDLEKAEEYAKKVQAKLEQMGKDLGIVIRERDKARTECNQYWEEATTKVEEYKVWHEHEMSRVQEAHASEMQALSDQTQKDKDQLNARIVNMTKAHRDETTQMQTSHQEKIAAHDKAMQLLEDNHSIQLRQLTDNHTAVLNQMEENHKNELNGVTGQLQGKVDSLKRHVANYSNRGDYTAISDDDFRNNFQLLARRINNLISWVPRPEILSFDIDLDPSGFFARNAQQGGRNWPKFVRNICWRAIVRGFYTRQLGFGAFGGEGSEGFDLLDQLHQLFAIPDPQGTSDNRVVCTF